MTHTIILPNLRKVLLDDKPIQPIQPSLKNLELSSFHKFMPELKTSNKNLTQVGSKANLCESSLNEYLRIL
jgi:hypothetical protein